MPQPLNYIPIRFRMRQSYSQGAALAFGIFATMFGLCVKFHADTGFKVCAGILAIISAAVAIILYFFHVEFECTIEGETLLFGWLGEERARSIRIADIKEINTIWDNESDRCELVLRDARRFYVNALAPVIAPYRRSTREFKAALLSVNPQITFARRSINTCHACGKRMKPNHYPESQCSECGAKKPQPRGNESLGVETSSQGGQ